MHGHSHSPPTVERRGDVVVVGASPAALTVAADLGARGRSVIVVDDAGTDAEARETVRRHGVEVLDARVQELGEARVSLTGGNALVASRVLNADELDGADEARVAAEVDAALAEAGTGSANEADWDHRYGSDRVWSGNPNGALVAEVEGMSPGRALDVGAGEGGDAVWLAEHGWRVTAADISGRALERVAAEAGRRGLDIALLHTDANADDPFDGATFDLAVAMYASIPRTADGRGVRNLLGAVAPGGTLLVVSHDLAPMRTPIDVTTASRGYDPDAYVRVDDVAAAVAGDDGWGVERHELRARPPGATSSHHVDDVVLRLRRNGA
jgi:SAM-dependent methyltransferase